MGTPSAVYRRPVNRFVAGFLGSPQMNFLAATADLDEAGRGLRVPGAGRLALPAACVVPLARMHTLGVRPEHWRLLPADAPVGLDALVDRVEWLGDVTLVHCRLAGHGAAPADAAVLSVKAGPEAGAALRHGSPVRLPAQPHDLMLFDPEGRTLAV